MKLSLLALLLSCFHFSSFAAVILQYHHVSDKTPPSTSISPTQFEKHMQYLADNNFNVIALSELMNAIKKQQPIADNTVVITFDDAYLDILTNGKPILDKFNYPYTIFINPAIVERGSRRYLSWEQLKTMASQGAIIANHGMEHNSIARISDGITEQQWLQKNADLLLNAENMIKEKTGQSWRYFAYPYGEYTPAIQTWIEKHDFIAFSQQSGAVGLATDLTSVPRFPVSKPYDQISSLRDKLKSLPFKMSLNDENAQTIVEFNQSKSVTFDVIVDDFHPSQLNCYISGLGKQKIQWHEENSFTINYSAPLPIGRVRCNCTAPSISEPGRYYWYSKPWFVLKKGKEWYAL
jgi:peptidoglycan/xylan/chitin deacetylase (PgdA/CDA1 family)